MHALKWVEIGSNKLKKNESMILYPSNGSTRSAFGLISSIISYGEKLVFVWKMYRTLEFDNHFQAFRILKREDRFRLAISPYDLRDMNVYQYHSPGSFRSNNLYVSTRTELISDVLWCIWNVRDGSMNKLNTIQQFCKLSITCMKTGNLRHWRGWKPILYGLNS